MASELQIAANRRNALRSTGPRTAAGKARSSRNHLTHGLRSKAELLPGEDAAAFQSLIAQLHAEHPGQPQEVEDFARAVPTPQ